MNEADCIVGIDVAKRKLDMAVQINGKIKSKIFDNTPAGHADLMQWLIDRGAKPHATHICMEATGPYSETTAIALVEAGWRVSVVNPARIKGFAQGELARNKTDRRCYFASVPPCSPAYGRRPRLHGASCALGWIDCRY